MVVNVLGLVLMVDGSGGGDVKRQAVKDSQVRWTDFNISWPILLAIGLGRDSWEVEKRSG